MGWASRLNAVAQRKREGKIPPNSSKGGDYKVCEKCGRLHRIGSGQGEEGNVPCFEQFAEKARNA